MDLSLPEIEDEIRACLRRIEGNLHAIDRGEGRPTHSKDAVPPEFMVLEKQLADTASLLRDFEAGLEDEAVADEEYNEHFNKFTELTMQFQQVVAEVQEVKRRHAEGRAEPTGEANGEERGGEGITEQTDGWDIDEPITNMEMNELQPAAVTVEEAAHSRTPPTPSAPTSDDETEERRGVAESRGEEPQYPRKPKIAWGPPKPAEATRAEVEAAALLRTRALLASEIDRVASIATLLSQDSDVLTGTLEEHERYAKEVEEAKDRVKKVKEQERRDARYVFLAFLFLLLSAMYISSRRFMWLFGVQLP